MKIQEVAEWRGWIWIGLMVAVSTISAAVHLSERAEGYADARVSDLRLQVDEQYEALREDLRLVREDLRRFCLRSEEP